MLEQITDIVREAAQIVLAARDIPSQTHEKTSAADLVTEYDLAVERFLKEKLPETAFDCIRGHLSGWYVDLGTKDTMEEKTADCNRALQGTGYSVKAEFEETYCAGAYFLSVMHP